ncbi:HEAT repeat domain-containing protein [Hymenobacter guriensis]|uniref:HEAT repeat domain-containing protein n=1 Tax=Hymenobacter guriensis TaxID=2793065 RepID=A0ABS0L2I3_9BACT|nr:HEAT repeat domain-containing protein [Hymenobacter guriensis]MBG8554175.1 HEAT repeat domain-containing protein [Hymenobacter guriensis]
MQATRTATLQALVLGDDDETADDAFEELTELGGEEVFQFLLQLLETDKPLLRNRAAGSLRDLADQRAIQPLLAAIQKPANHGRNGTLVYALATHDCCYLLKDLCLIVFYQGYEAKHMALDILEEQEFVYSEEDVQEIRRLWEQVRQKPDRALQEIGLNWIEKIIEEL